MVQLGKILQLISESTDFASWGPTIRFLGVGLSSRPDSALAMVGHQGASTVQHQAPTAGTVSLAAPFLGPAEISDFRVLDVTAAVISAA